MIKVVITSQARSASNTSYEVCNGAFLLAS